MEPKGSSSSSFTQDPATQQGHKPDEFSPHALALFLYVILILSPLS
jgi:hypothetical protein